MTQPTTHLDPEVVHGAYVKGIHSAITEQAAVEWLAPPAVDTDMLGTYGQEPVKAIVSFSARAVVAVPLPPPPVGYRVRAGSDGIQLAGPGIDREDPLAVTDALYERDENFIEAVSGVLFETLFDQFSFVTTGWKDLKWTHAVTQPRLIVSEDGTVSLMWVHDLDGAL